VVLAVEYHKAVRSSIPATLAFFLVLPFGALLAPDGTAQISAGPTASVGSGPHTGAVAPPTGAVAPPTGTVAPPTGISTGRGNISSHAGGNLHSHISQDGGDHHHHRHAANGIDYFPYVYGVPVPYAADATDTGTEDDESEYQGGPTVFDRRGSGADSYVQPTYSGPAHPHPAVDSGAMPTNDPSPAAETSVEPLQPATVLVFKDGHQIEVGNYAIVGQTLYDLTPSHPRKVALAGLDLAATQKQNDDRGVVFQLPPSSQAN
jgi:hypothetical protein